MTSKLLLSCGAAALLLAACDGPPPAPAGMGPNAVLKVSDRLNCPDRQGDLDRVSAASDGRSCLYRGDNSEVELRLTPVAGTAEATLGQVEAQLRPLSSLGAAPAATPPGEDSDAPEVKTVVEDAGAVDVTAAEHQEARAARDAGHSDWDAHDHERVNIRLPGLHIDAQNEKADIRVGPLRIKADGDGDRVSVKRDPRSGIGRSFSLEADDGGAEIRMDDGGKANVEAMLILASDDAGKDGHQTVGYVARGPRAGPLVVATIRVKDEHKGDIFDDATALVKKNVRKR